MPPGATFDEITRTITFTPDFIQGGNAWTATVRVPESVSVSFTITVRDSIAPPEPTIESTVSGFGYKRLTVHQTTDTYLDSPGYAGRVFTAYVHVPDGASVSNPMPVQVVLHGFGGSPYDGVGTADQFRIYAHDPMNSYWWGYGDGLPSGVSSTVPNYTQRRVLHLLHWVLQTYPGADANRVFVSGGSMGGAGATTLGLLYARHFAFVEAAFGQMIPRNHRPDRLSQLQTIWGSVSNNLPDGTSLENGRIIGGWDRQDVCRILREVPEARDQFLMTKHGKDDATIHFGAVTLKSPFSNESYHEAVKQQRIGHYAVWDEGGHAEQDPIMGRLWWDDGFSLVSDSMTYLRLDRAFPAFTRASHDWDPGDGSGNGKQEWNDDSGFAGLVTKAGDTGWSGDIAGALNRFLRWDANSVVDTWHRFEIELFVADGTGSDPPKDGYPSFGDKFDKVLPVLVDVTPRRVQRFRCLPSERVQWELDGRSGTVAANADGSVTVPQIPLETSKKKLVLTRESQP